MLYKGLNILMCYLGVCAWMCIVVGSIWPCNNVMPSPSSDTSGLLIGLHLWLIGEFKLGTWWVWNISIAVTRSVVIVMHIIKTFLQLVFQLFLVFCHFMNSLTLSSFVHSFGSYLSSVNCLIQWCVTFHISSFNSPSPCHI